MSYHGVFYRANGVSITDHVRGQKLARPAGCLFAELREASRPTVFFVTGFLLLVALVIVARSFAAPMSPRSAARKCR